MNPERPKVFLIVIGSVITLCLFLLGIDFIRQTDFSERLDTHIETSEVFHDSVMLPFVENTQGETAEQLELFKQLLKSNCVNATESLKGDEQFVEACEKLGIQII